MNDLIERLKAIDLFDLHEDDAKAIREAITTLSPAPLPEDVEEITRKLRWTIDGFGKFQKRSDTHYQTKAADLIERLARDFEACDADRANYYRIAEECEQETFELKQLIEELERENKGLTLSNVGFKEVIYDQQQRIEKLDEASASG